MGDSGNSEPELDQQLRPRVQPMRERRTGPVAHIAGLGAEVREVIERFGWRRVENDFPRVQRDETVGPPWRSRRSWVTTMTPVPSATSASRWSSTDFRAGQSSPTSGSSSTR